MAASAKGERQMFPRQTNSTDGPAGMVHDLFVDLRPAQPGAENPAALVCKYCTLQKLHAADRPVKYL